MKIHTKDLKLITFNGYSGEIERSFSTWVTKNQNLVIVEIVSYKYTLLLFYKENIEQS